MPDLLYHVRCENRILRYLGGITNLLVQLNKITKFRSLFSAVLEGFIIFQNSDN